MDCSLPCSSVHGILQVRTLWWLAMASSGGSSQPRDQTQVSHFVGGVLSLPTEPPGKPKNTGVGSLSLLQGIFLTQESNRGLLHCRQILHTLYQLTYQGSPIMVLNGLEGKGKRTCMLNHFSHFWLCDPLDYSSPGFSVHGIFQARILRRVAISFSNVCMHAKLLQSCSTLCDPMDNSPPGSSVHGILKAGILEWVGCHFLLHLWTGFTQ